MRFLSSSLALFLSIALAAASVPRSNLDIAARHHGLAHNLQVRSAKKCPNRTNKPADDTAAASKGKPAGSSSSKAAQPPKATPPTKAAPPAAPPVKQVPSGAGGLINVQSPNCGPSRATRQVTQLSGPNGHIDWLNCGFETSGGWTPPTVHIPNLITVSLPAALQSPSSPFKACSAFVGIFEKYGAQYGIPSIILASFAMQESSCNPATVGGAGEQGLMQITREKCGGAPGGDCKNPDFNIGTAARYFKATLDSYNGNVVEAVGTYNGWRPHLTKGQAFAAGNTDCCRCQNNGDYLHQFFNGWCQNINAYDSKMRLGKYFNLDKCDD